MENYYKRGTAWQVRNYVNSPIYQSRKFNTRPAEAEGNNIKERIAYVCKTTKTDFPKYKVYLQK